MLRTVLAVLVSYIAMAVSIAVILTAALLILGSDRVYLPGSYVVSGLWLGVWAAGSVTASVWGGFVCIKIARAGSRAHVGLIGVVIVLGVLSALFTPTRPDPGPRAGDIPTLEAAQKSVQPGWTYWANIPIGAVGVLIGARVGRKPHELAGDETVMPSDSNALRNGSTFSPNRSQRPTDFSEMALVT